MQTKILLEDNLPFVTLTLTHNHQSIVLDRILIDTGSFGTVFPTDVVAQVGLFPQDEDEIVYLVGIGGEASVLQTQIDQITIGDVDVSPFIIQMGDVGSYLDINGILGVDFMLAAKLILDFGSLTVTTAA